MTRQAAKPTLACSCFRAARPAAPKGGAHLLAREVHVRLEESRTPSASLYG
jgi:hypothetical protein